MLVNVNANASSILIKNALQKMHILKLQKEIYCMSQLLAAGEQTYFQSSGAVGKTLPDLVVMMQPSMSNPAI